MKKLLTAIFVLGALVTLNAQKMTFGLKGGLNVMSIDYSLYEGEGGLQMKLGYHLGGSLEFSVSDKLAILPEMLFSTQGFGWHHTYGDNLKLHYLNIPLMVRYYFVEGLAAELGPQLGLLLATNGDRTHFSTFDFAVGGGLTYQLRRHYLIGIRYNKGITSINKSTLVPISRFNDLLQVSVGYIF